MASTVWRVKSTNPVLGPVGYEVFEYESFETQQRAINYLGEQVIRYQNDGWRVSRMYTTDDDGGLAVDLVDDNSLERHFVCEQIAGKLLPEEDTSGPTYYTDGEGFEVWSG